MITRRSHDREPAFCGGRRPSFRDARYGTVAPIGTCVPRNSWHTAPRAARMRVLVEGVLDDRADRIEPRRDERPIGHPYRQLSVRTIGVLWRPLRLARNGSVPAP